jgi:ABC-type sulfate transport system permease component
MENENIKKKKGAKLKERLLDSLFELIIALAAFAIGAGLLLLFGHENILSDWDPQLVILLGVLVLLAVAGIMIAVVTLIKKKKK